MFSQRHFVALATMLKEQKPDSTRSGKTQAFYDCRAVWQRIVVATADMGRSYNQRLDRQKFYESCGFE